jgi:hypothetical protein
VDLDEAKASAAREAVERVREEVARIVAVLEYAFLLIVSE